MIYVGIDVAKDKHDCFIMDSDGTVLFDVFTISNTRTGFMELLDCIKSVARSSENVTIGLESTGHFSYNIQSFLTDNNMPPVVINPLYTNQFRKATSLRRTKTDRIDARNIAFLLSSGFDFKPCRCESYHISELKSLTRYRFEKAQERGRLKVSVTRLVTILFPELLHCVYSIHSTAIYQMLLNYPSAKLIAEAHLTRLSSLLNKYSLNHFKKDFAIRVRAEARQSIGLDLHAKSIELQHTIKLIQEYDREIHELDELIKDYMNQLHSPIITIPGIGTNLGSIILAEIGDINRFENADKLLAFSGMSPSTYQSGTYESSNARMEKRGSKYLRYALFNAARYVCQWDPTFAAYLEKKQSEGKHYYVALSHVVKKLVRVIFHLLKTNQRYIPQR